MSELRVVITDYTFPNLDAEETAARRAGAQFIPNHCGSSEEVEAAVVGANVALVQFAQFTAKAAAALASGATVIRYGVGYDNIDLAGAKAAGVQVGFVPDYCTQIGGAALDVFEVEPLPSNSPLRDAPNLLFSPHAAWYSDAAIGKLQQLVADEIRRALAGQPPRCPVPLP